EQTGFLGALLEHLQPEHGIALLKRFLGTPALGNVLINDIDSFQFLVHEYGYAANLHIHECAVAPASAASGVQNLARQNTRADLDRVGACDVVLDEFAQLVAQNLLPLVEEKVPEHGIAD